LYPASCLPFPEWFITSHQNFTTPEFDTGFGKLHECFVRLCFQHKRYWPVIGQTDLHVRGKLTSRHFSMR